MKTSVIDVRGMLSALSVDGVEKRIGKVPGVESVTVNDAAGSATVRYDETLLEIADIKAAVHQSEYQSAGESEAKHESEQSPARKRAAVPTPKFASASASVPVANAPKASTVAPAVSGHEDHTAPGAQSSKPVAAVPKAAQVAPAVPAPAAPVVGGHQDHAAPEAQPSTPVAAAPKATLVAPAVPAPAAPAVGGHQDHAAPDAKPSTPGAAAPKAGPVVPAVLPAPAAKSSTPASAEPKTDFWKVHAFSLATTLGVAYISCAIFDVLFPPFGLLAAVASVSPWPISGSPLAFLTGFALFTIAGFVFGALYGLASKFWSKILG